MVNGWVIFNYYSRHKGHDLALCILVGNCLLLYIGRFYMMHYSPVPFSLSVSKIARNLNDFFWYRRKVSEGTKGPIEYEFSKKEVILSKDGLPWKTVWLIMKRTVGRNPIYSFYISNTPRSTRLKTFVWLSGIRWAIEQCFEETKTELGMDQYEVKKFAGWNHHMLTCMLAHFFLWHLKIRLGGKSASHYALAA